jgi:phospholipase/carboxylesterase
MLEAELVPALRKESRQLMVVLHGLGDSLEGYRWLPEALECPELNYLLVNAPDLYFGGYSWYDFASDPDAGVRRSRRMLFELLDHCRERGFPSNQTLLFGFSQGCLMTVDTGLRYGHALSGLVGISGYVHRPDELLQELAPDAGRMPILITHGVLDPMVPFASAREQFHNLKSRGLQIEWHEFPKVHTIDGEREMAVIRRFVWARLGR